MGRRACWKRPQFGGPGGWGMSTRHPRGCPFSQSSYCSLSSPGGQGPLSRSREYVVRRAWGAFTEAYPSPGAEEGPCARSQAYACRLPTGPLGGRQEWWLVSLTLLEPPGAAGRRQMWLLLPPPPTPWPLQPFPKLPSFPWGPSSLSLCTGAPSPFSPRAGREAHRQKII